jgi:hypothetical protein
MPVSREQLYAECWAEPMTKVAARHGVSSSFMARICDRMNVPRPPRGYWSKLAVGKASAKPDLPSPRPGDEVEWVRDGEHRTRHRHPPTAPAAPIETDIPVAPPKRLPRGSLHPLVRSARAHFEKVRSSNNGYLRPYKKLLVDLYVSKDSLDRALKLANHVFLALEERGYPVSLARGGLYFGRPELDERLEPGPTTRYYPNEWRPYRPTVTLVGTVAIGLTIFELSEHVEADYSNGVYVRAVRDQRSSSRRAWGAEWISKYDMPSSLLCVRATSPYPVANWEKSWRESKRGELKRMIPDIIKELESDAGLIAELVRKGEEKAAAEHAAWEEQSRKWELEERERRRAKRIEKSRAELMSLVDEWRRAKGITDFFEDVQRHAGQLSAGEQEALADRARKAQELLGGVNALQKLLQWRTPADLERTAPDAGLEDDDD